MYKYTDRQGTVVITDRFDSVPQQYRKRMTVIKDVPAPSQQAMPPLPVPQVESVVEAKQVQPEPVPGSWHERFRLPLLLVAALIVSFFVIRKLATIAGQQKIGHIVFVVFSVSIAVYFFRCHLDQLASTFGVLKKDAQNIKKNVETREQMTDRMLQQMQEKR